MMKRNHVPWAICFVLLTVCAAVIVVGCGQSAKYSGMEQPDLSVAADREDTWSPLRIAADQFSLRGEAAARDDGSTRLLAELSPGEELWVITRPAPADQQRRAAARDDLSPGSGALVATLPGQKQTVPVPLKHTDVKASVSAYVATVNVTQQFYNPYDSKIEAVYVFPLPQNAAVNEFVMTIGERRIRGIIREREEAEKIYAAARRQGYVASLLTQERPNIFTQKVANIEPGKRIDINIKYFSTLAYADGWYEFVFPMVVGPRYNPPGSTDGVGAVGRGKAGISGQKTEVQYLRPEERSGHDVALSVTIDAVVEIEESRSVNHAVDSSAPSPTQLATSLRRLDRIPNKDFVLRYRVAGGQIKSNMLTCASTDGGFFTLMLYPPQYLKTLQRQPMEMVFVLDCSGSMRGRPIEQAKKAISRGLNSMEASDTFQIIRFSSDASQLGPEPVVASAGNVRQGLGYLKSLEGGGGTQMIEGIKAALDFPHDPQRYRVVSFMTDGYIGNEAQILGQMHRRLGASRVFSFGVGQSPNRYLLDRMATLGRGAVAYLGLNDSAADVMDDYFERVSHPAMTDVTIDWGGLKVTDVYPKRISDLIVGRPVILTGRYQLPEGRRPADTRIRITGRAGGRDVGIDVPVDLADAKGDHPGIRSVWARMKIADLANQRTHTRDPGGELASEIKQVALDYSLMSAYTAFVAVDSRTRTAGDHGTTVHVPVPVPEGARYDTTVRE